MEGNEVRLGDCLEVLRILPDASVDSLVTDPPAGISFMGKDWDGDKGGRAEWVAWMSDVMRECLRVMKPGAHGLIWALPRTSHWTATALEDAGFEIRDCVYHLFGQGFPKSLDVSKAIDKAAGADRSSGGVNRPENRVAFGKGAGALRCLTCGNSRNGTSCDCPPSPAVTDDAKRWSGWGTALKPAVECWWLVRKPLSEKSVAANVLKWGTGALNIDGSRIPGAIPQVPQPAFNSPTGITYGMKTGEGRSGEMSRAEGRFPSHLVLSHTEFCTDVQCDIECAVAMLDAQSGFTKSPIKTGRGAGGQHGRYGKISAQGIVSAPGDSGGASRFFYCAKISPSERNAGLDDAPDKVLAFSGGAAAAAARGEEYDNGDGGMNRTRVVKNHHPTVKPQKLMRYLCKLVTPPGGMILDPFAGSGSTGVAAKAMGFQFLGIEMNEEYIQIASKRIASAEVSQ